ncbi:MAG: hypothetical protein ACREQ4_08280 [Candidatus Binataceae bacterium]
MRTSTVTLSITIALLAGLAIGFAGTNLAYRHRLLRVPGEGPLARMIHTLKLTPAQTVEVGEVMQDTHDKMRELRTHFRHQRLETLVGAYGQIRGLLSSDQQRRFDQDFVPPKLRRRISLASPSRQMDAATRLPPNRALITQPRAVPSPAQP